MSKCVIFQSAFRYTFSHYQGRIISTVNWKLIVVCMQIIPDFGSSSRLTFMGRLISPLYPLIQHQKFATNIVMFSLVFSLTWEIFRCRVELDDILLVFKCLYGGLMDCRSNFEISGPISNFNRVNYIGTGINPPLLPQAMYE